MIVQNLKTKKEFEITKSDWAKLTSTKQHRLYKIIISDDTPQKKKIYIPEKVVEYQQDISKLKIKQQEKPKE